SSRSIIYGDLVYPSEQRTAEVKAADREKNLGKNLLSNVFCVVVVAEDSENDGKHLRLVPLDDVAKRHFVASLHPADQVRFLTLCVIHSGLLTDRVGCRHCQSNRG